MPAEVVKKGNKIGLASYDSYNSRNPPYAAGYAVGFGLPYDEAMKAITNNPAQIWGVDKDLGSLENGKMANVLVANGDPLAVKEGLTHVFIGRQVMPPAS